MSETIQFTGNREEFLAKAREMMTEEDISEGLSKAGEIILQARHIYAAEEHYTKRLETDDLASRDEADRLYADMQAMFTLSDYDAALALVRRRFRAVLQTPHKEKTPA